MSLLRNAYSNRKKRKDSINKYIDVSHINISTLPINNNLIEPDYGLGYKSSQSKIIYLSQDNLMIGVKGIRAFWKYLYGVNPSGSPQGISTLLENIHKTNPNNIKGWNIEEKGTNYIAKFTHHPRCIKILTNDTNRLMRLLMKVNNKDTSIWRISYKDLEL